MISSNLCENGLKYFGMPVIWAPPIGGLDEIDGLFVPSGKVSYLPTDQSDYWLTAHVCVCQGKVIYSNHPYKYPGSQKSLSRKKKLEVTSPAIVVLNAFLDSSDLPKEGLSGLLWKFFGVMLYSDGI